MDNFSNFSNFSTFAVLVHLSKNLDSQTHNFIHVMGFRRTALEHILCWLKTALTQLFVDKYLSKYTQSQYHKLHIGCVLLTFLFIHLLAAYYTQLILSSL